SVGIGVGWVVAQEEFIVRSETQRIPLSGHVRIGNPQRIAFAVRLMESLPLYSGGGQVELGIELEKQKIDARIALSAFGPYDNPGLGLRGGYRWTPATRSELQLRLGRAGGRSESAVSIRIDQRIAGGR